MWDQNKNMKRYNFKYKGEIEVWAKSEEEATDIFWQMDLMEDPEKIKVEDIEIVGEE
jgi:hypothetical protein